MIKSTLIRILFCFLSAMVLNHKLSSQALELDYSSSKIEYDTNYIETFEEFINARLYFSRKFTSIHFEEQTDNFRLQYQPNTTLNFGIGATVNGFTLNIAYGFPFLNQDKSKGKTSYLDLQSHIYGRKYAIDLFSQFYRGMYLDNTSDIYANYPVNHYLRPDIGIVVLGGSYFRVLNHRRFSYSASLVQNEWQKKSAGSFLWGGKLLLMGASSDSSMIPSYSGDSLFNALDSIRNLSSLQIGPGIGYTHTFVVKQHFFFTISLDLNLMLSAVSYEQENRPDKDELQINPSFDVRAAIGYNSKNSYFGLSYVEDESQMKSVDRQVFSKFAVGNVRLNYVRRFRMSSKFKRIADKYIP